MRTRPLPGIAAVLVASLCFSSAAAQTTARPAQAPANAAANAAASFSPTGDGFIAHGNLTNTSGLAITLDNIGLNRQVTTRALFTNQYRAEGSLAPYDNHPANLFFSIIDQQWEIFNADNVGMPAGTAWNIYIPPQDGFVITHTTTGNTNIGPRAIINYGAVFNGHPELLLFVSPELNPAESPVTSSVTIPLAVAYDTPLSRWSVMNADNSTMQDGYEFVVLGVSPGANAFTTITRSGIFTDASELDNPLINDNPDALLLITQNYGTGVTNSALNHRTGVKYDAGLGRWFIANADGALMPNGIMFNVLVIPPRTGYFVQTQGNIPGYSARLDNPDLDGNPYARVYVMHNYNPAESQNNHLDDHAVGVFYNSGGDHHWYVYNRDFQSITPGSTFNVYYTWPRGNSFQVSADTPNSVTVTSLNLNSPQLDEHSGVAPIASFTKFAGGFIGADYSAMVGFHFSGLLWRIFNNSGPNFPRRMSYNVLVPPPAASLVVTAITGPGSNMDGNWLYLDSPLTNDNPRALIFATPRDNGGIQTHNVGAFYYNGRWIIYNEDLLDIVTGQAFDVFIIPRFRALLPLVVK